MITFYLVRHGETLFNQLSLMQGWCDSPLTEKGIQQAEELALRLKDIPFTSAYSSTSERAIDTAHILMKEHTNLTLMPMKDLKELNFGLYEGAQQYLVHKNPAFSTFDFINVGGDNRDTLVTRIIQGLTKIVKQAQDGEHILIVTHGAAIMNLIVHLNPVIAKAMKQNPAKAGIRNCSAHAITYNNGVFEVKGVDIDRN